MTTTSYHTHSVFEKAGGYSRAVRRGEFVFVAGTTGFDYQTMTISSNLNEQVEQTLKNVNSALRHFSLNFSNIVQCIWVVTDRDSFWPAAAQLKVAFGELGPPMMTLVCDLVDPRMKFEMQVIALVPAVTDS